MGSDYPFPLGDLNHGCFIEQMDLPLDTKERVLWKNAVDFLGRPPIAVADYGGGNAAAIESSNRTSGDSRTSA